MTPEDLAGIPPARLPFPITRALPTAVECRADSPDDGIGLLSGQFSTFGDWYEVDSVFEGHFMERVASSAFKKTVAESRDSMKILYDHGQDPTIGNKVLAPIREVTPTARYTGPLFDTSYNRDLLPGLKAGVYGSSFRFTVEKDEWDHTPEVSDHNPAGISERTITEARVFEFGPVTFPANPRATAGARSTTDTFYQRSRDPETFEALLRSAQVARTPQGAAAQASEPPSDTPPEPSRSDTPEAIEPAVMAEAEPKESRNVATEYITRDEKSARVRELEASITARATQHPGVYPENVQTTDDAENKEHDDLVRDIAAWDKHQARLQAFASDPAHTVPAFEVPQIVKRQTETDIFDLNILTGRGFTQAELRQRLRDDAMRQVDQARFGPQADSQKTRDRVGYLIDNQDTATKELATSMRVTGSPQYRAAFMDYLRTGRDAELLRYAPLTTGTAGTGGYATPWVLDPSFIHVGAWTNVNPFRQACRVVDLVGTNKWEALTITAVLAAYQGEATAVAEGGPATVDQPTYNCLKAQAFVTLSIELLEDRPDIGGEIATLIQEAKDTLEENYFSVGAGTTVPWGVALLNEYTTKKTHGAAAVDIADIYAMEMDLPIRYRPNAAWFMSRATIRAVQGFETVGGILFNANTTGVGYPAVGNPVMNRFGNTGLQLLGYPVYEAPSITSTLTTPDSNPIVFCDPKSYIIVDRVGLNIEAVPFIFADAAGTRPMGQRGIYAHWRNTARRVNVDAGRTLVIE